MDNDTKLLCKTGYMNKMGFCANPPKSLRKGLNCTVDSNCETSEKGVYAKCSCTYNQGKPKYCGNIEGDMEWQEESKTVSFSVWLS